MATSKRFPGIHPDEVPGEGSMKPLGLSGRGLTAKPTCHRTGSPRS